MQTAVLCLSVCQLPTRKHCKLITLSLSLSLLLVGLGQSSFLRFEYSDY